MPWEESQTLVYGRAPGRLTFAEVTWDVGEDLGVRAFDVRINVGGRGSGNGVRHGSCMSCRRQSIGKNWALGASLPGNYQQGFLGSGYRCGFSCGPLRAGLEIGGGSGVDLVDGGSWTQ